MSGDKSVSSKPALSGPVRTRPQIVKSADVPPVEVVHLSKRFGDRTVLDDVSLKLAPGEVLAIIGPSGAGKSTLLRCINYVETPSAGMIYVAGRQIGGRRRLGRALPPSARELSELRRSVGMVFQSFNLFPHLSALENVVLGQVHALGRPKSDARDRAKELLTSVGLADHMGRRPNRLSGGEQQRVAIARALALDPQVMLFDEPTSSIDPELRHEVLGVMRKLAGDGMTMMVVTHEMRFAADVADRVIFMAEGRPIEEGSPDEVFRNPQQERTRRFLGAIFAL